jgi:hypothetical protein
LPQQVWQHWAVAVSAGCKLHRPEALLHKSGNDRTSPFP